MNKSFSSKISQTDWKRIDAMKDEDIDLSDIPEITETQMARAVLRVGGKPIEQDKLPVNMLLDTSIVEYFKAKAGNKADALEESHSYQALINAALKEYIKGQDLKEELRHIFREELARSAQNTAQH